VPAQTRLGVVELGQICPAQCGSIVLLQTSFRFADSSTDGAFERRGVGDLLLGGSVGYMAIRRRFSILSVYGSVMKLLLEILLLGKADIASIALTMANSIEDVLGECCSGVERPVT
jgi:hypothetical protein